MPTQAASSTDITNNDILGDATLQPGQEASIDLGLYEADYQPELAVDVSPKSCIISSTLERERDNEGDYRMKYRLHNSQSIPCLVTIRQLA
jgi:hypothetical protein